MRVFARQSLQLWQSLLLVLFLLTTTQPAYSANQSRAVFGPEKFVRATGEPTVFTRTFGIAPIVGAPYSLQISNGDVDGSKRVNSAAVSIDGQEVVHQNDFSGTAATIDRPLTLAAGAHTLEVRLISVPDSHFTLTISGVIALADLTRARSGHTATLLGDDTVLIAGDGTAEIFDGAALTTSALAGAMRASRKDHAAATLARPQTLLVGGADGSATLNTAELYGHVSKAFTALASTTQITRSGATASVLPDGRILILGGIDASGNTVSASEAFDPTRDPLTGALYDPATATFRFLPNALSVPRSNHTATVRPDGTVLIAGGRNADGLLASAEIVNPVTGTSTLLAAAMSTARAEHSATLLPDGGVLIAGGRGASGVLASMETFKANAFTASAVTLRVARANHTATLLASGEILVAGGDSAGGPTANTELIGPPAEDATAPTAAAFSPANGATGVDRNIVVAVRFSEPVVPSSLNAQTARLTIGTAAVPATITVAADGLYAFLAPPALLLSGTTYTVTLDGVRDLAGNALPVTMSAFTTLFPPAITSFTPTHGLPGTVVTINGTNFDAASPDRNRVTVGGQPVTVSAATATSLTIIIPQLAAGPHPIRVETRGGAVVAADAFIVDNPVPLLTSIAPSEVTAGSAATSIVLTGLNFVPGATAVLGTTSLATQFVSATQLTALIPAAELTTAATLMLKAVNPAPGGGASNALPFVVKTTRGSIGNYVWRDADRDGVQGDSELGVTGVSVRLLTTGGGVVAITTTNVAGAYHFNDVASGDYIVEFNPPDGYAFTTTHAVADDAIDSDADTITGRSGVITVTGADHNGVDCGLYTPPATVTTSPSDGEASVALTRETIFRLSSALAANETVTDNDVFAEQGGARLGARIHVAPDRKTITLFYDRDLPSSARVRVTLVGDSLRDAFDAPIDGDGDGIEGGTRTVDFDTVTLTTLPNTKVCGRVFASRLAPNGLTSINVPLQNVTITVDGIETTLRTTTNSLGNFCLDPAPVGNFFVHIDGRTATNNIDPGDYYPTVGKLWSSVAGETRNIGDIFLPLIVTGTLQPVSRTSDTTITLPPAVLAQFPQFAGVKIIVPADALYSDDGSRGGRVGIAPVPPDRLPEPLPPGLAFPIVITVQTDGAQNFDKPVPACFPNLPNANGATLAPGAQSALWSFNHDTGHFEIVGPMTVSADGTLVCTDPGVGILAPGWHGTQPGTSGNSEPPAEEPDEPDCDEIKNDLHSDYEAKVGTAAVVLAHQLACLANDACPSNPFVEGMLSRIAGNIGNNPVQNSCDDIPDWIPLTGNFGINAAELCAPFAGAVHFFTELFPGFYQHCRQTGEPITEEEHQPLIDAIPGCFDEIRDAGEIGDFANGVAQKWIPRLAVATRIGANLLCALTPGAAELKTMARPMAVESLVAREELFIPELDTTSSLRVRAADGSYFLNVGTDVPLRVTRLSGSGETDVTSTSLFFAVVDDDSVTVTPAGLLSLRKAFPTAGVPRPFLVVVRNGDEFAIGQFAIVDADSDADGIVDSAEQRVGTDPLVFNGHASDLDSDGISDLEETASSLNPRLADSDGDRIDDSSELLYGFNPLRSSTHELTRTRTALHYSITNLATNIILRAMTTPEGTVDNIILAPNQRYRGAYYNAREKTIASVDFSSGGSGSRTNIPIAFLAPSTAGDADNDGIPDDGEAVIGTNPNNPDTDGDGIKDGAELEQGTDPLDGRMAGTGIIATAPTPGNAVDVTALDDLVAVATSTAGVALFNVFNGMTPTVIAQIDTPGDAQQVALGGRMLAVADGAQGLAIIDVSDPTNAQLVRQVPLIGNTQCVAVSAGVAYAGTDAGRVALIDLASGSVLREITGLGSVHDVGIDREMLYVATYNQLRFYELSSLQFYTAITLTYPPDALTRRRRIFAGGNEVYVTSYVGYDAFDTSFLQLGEAARDHGPSSFKQIVSNGNGRGVAAVGVNPRDDGTHDVYLYATLPGRTGFFITILPTPGQTRAITIYNGLAYAADGLSGLQVMNYMSMDVGSSPPTLNLQSNFVLFPGEEGGAEEGKAMRVTALTTDDVQVRNVEFFIDGVRTVDGNFPFEHRFITPLMSQQPSFRMRACVSDTGGNRVCTQEQTITLTTDATPPAVTAVAPANNSGAAFGTVSAASATFSEPIDAATLTNASFRLFGSGPDLAIGTGDDVLITGGVVSYRDDSNRAFLTFPSPLPIDTYRAVISATVKDLHGNPVGADYVWTFRIRGPLVWINPAGGDWHTAANWNEGVVPGPADTARITLAGNYTVTISRNAEAGKLYVGGTGSTPTLWVRGNSANGNVALTVTELLDNAGTIRVESTDSNLSSRIAMPAGTLLNRGAIRFNNGSGGERRIDAALLQSSGTFDVNLGGTFAGLLSNTGTVTIAAGQQLTVPAGLVQLEAGTIGGPGLLRLDFGQFNFDGGTVATAPLLVNAGVAFGPLATGAASFILTGPNARLSGKSSPGQTVSIRGSSIGGHTRVAASGGFVNGGLLRLESTDSAFDSEINVFGNNFVNASSGTIEVAAGSGGQRTISGLPFTNRGTLNVSSDLTVPTFANEGTVNVAASRKLTITRFAWFTQTSGKIDNAGIFEMRDSTFFFNGGTVEGVPPRLFTTSLTIGPGSTGVGTFDMMGAPGAFLPGGVLTGTLAPAQTVWIHGSTLGGNATITAAAGFKNNGTLRLESTDSNFSSNLTGSFTNDFGGVVQINAGSGGLRQLTGTVTNNGIINVNLTTTLAGAMNNNGTVNVAASQTLSHAPNGGAIPTWNQNAGTLALNGAYELGQGDFNFAGGTITGNSPLLGNSKLALTAAGAASFRMIGTLCRASGIISPLQTVWINGGTFSNATLTTVGTLTNQGTLRAETSDGTFSSNVTGTVINAAGATINLNAGTGGARTLSGTFTNNGTLNINLNASLLGTLTNNSTMNIASGQSLTITGAPNVLRQNGGSINGPGSLALQSMTFDYNGGPITAPVTIFSGLLNLGGSTDPATFVVTAAPQVTGTIAPGQLLWVRGSSAGGHTTLTAPSGLTNAGTLRLESGDSTLASNLTIGSGALTNTGRIEIRTGSGGTRTITGNLINQGTVEVSTALTYAGTSFQNAAAGTIRGDGSITFVTGALSNAGTIAPGLSPGILTIQNVTQAPAGIVAIEIGGLAAGTAYDRLAVTNTTLDGTLNLTLTGGYVPNLGDAFDVMTWTSRTGTFLTINGTSIGGGKKLQPTYATDKLTLTVVPE